MRDRYYWDSCAFLAYLQDEEGADLCELVLDAAKEGKVLIVTSALTIAEVLNLRGCDKVPRSKRDQAHQLFQHEYIHVRNVTRKTAEAARDLYWDHDVAPKDAVHVASALEAKVPILNTFDKNLIAKGAILAPALRVGTPFYYQQKELPLEDSEEPAEQTDESPADQDVSPGP
ncbi:MAG: type II toxin-antitoxin system VapC family toxin [Actinobacteria bacterium]|nr:type II toxin-antitoxin system VapC family toxin [Actinomycetota bacterium]